MTMERNENGTQDMDKVYDFIEANLRYGDLRAVSKKVDAKYYTFGQGFRNRHLNIDHLKALLDVAKANYDKKKEMLNMFDNLNND